MTSIALIVALVSLRVRARYQKWRRDCARTKSRGVWVSLALCESCNKFKGHDQDTRRPLYEPSDCPALFARPTRALDIWSA